MRYPSSSNRELRRDAVFLLPFAVLGAIAAASIFAARSHSFRFQDGSFSLHAPFWLILPLNFGRLFWFWGLLSLVAILILRPSRYREILTIALAWIGISLIPYSFLTYSKRIPSRQLHLASVGVAIVVGFALLILYEQMWPRRRAVVLAVCGLIVAHNVIYLWTKKRNQFLERAAPTEQLIAFARATKGPIYVQCFPRPPLVARSAVELMISPTRSAELLFTPQEWRKHPDAARFCYPLR